MAPQSGTLAACAWSDGPSATADAVARACAGVRGDGPALVLIFPDASLEGEEVAAQAARAAAGAPLAGMTGVGVLDADGVHEGGCLAFALSAEMAAGVGVARHASRDLRAAGAAATRTALAGLEMRPGHGVVLLFVDPLSGDEATVIDGAYAVAGGHVPLAGGGANGARPRVYGDGAAHADAVLAVAVASPAPVGVGVAHGCRSLATPAIATRTEGRVLQELDGRPAEEVYLEGLGHAGARLDDDAFEALAVLHPLAQPELRGQMRLRHVMGRAPRGGLACATAIPPNAALWFTQQSRESIVASGADAVRQAVAALEPARPPRAGLVFDCAARRRAMGDALADEAAVLRDAYGDVQAFGGLYTRGEVGRTRGAKGDRNHAVVAVGFA